MGFDAAEADLLVAGRRGLRHRLSVTGQKKSAAAYLAATPGGVDAATI
jgi:hypothetical protein